MYKVALIREQNSRIKLEIGTEIRERIKVVFTVKPDMLVKPSEISLNTDVIRQISIDGIGFNKHTDGVFQPFISSVMNGRI